MMTMFEDQMTRTKQTYSYRAISMQLDNKLLPLEAQLADFCPRE